MEHTNNKRPVIVGIFIFIGIAIFVASILTLGSQHKTFEKSINVKVFFPDVNGLQKGNNVWFSGVKIGTVKKIELTPGNLVEVDLTIEEKSKKFIRSDAKAKVSSDGLIGNKIVLIYDGTMQSPEIEKDNILGTEKIRNTEDMINTLAKTNDNLLEITNGFKTIVTGMAKGQGTVGKLLTDETLINQLNATAASLKKSSGNVEILTTQLSDYTAKLNTKGSPANELVSDTVIFTSLRSALTQFKKVAETSQAVVENLKQSSTQLTEGLNNNEAPIGMLLHDKQSAANLKTILVNLQGGSKKLDDDLEAVQHNFLLRGFFKKKEKREKADSAR